jgi:DNA-binding transcriptional LysR family regulator
VKLNGIDLNKLTTFGAVAERSSVTQAAAALGRTRSAVSQSITALEGALDLPLFHRIGKRLVLTPAGERLRDSVRESQRSLRAALDEIVDSGGEVRGTVRAGIFLGFPRQRLAALLTRFGTEHPRAAVRVVFAPEGDLNRRLQLGRLDLTVSFRLPSRVRPHVRSSALFEEQLVLVSGGTFFRNGFSIAELERTPVIDYYQSDPLIDRWLRHHCAGQDVAPRVTVWAATTDLVVDLIAAGAGVGVVPHYLVAAHVANGTLRILERRRRGLTDTIWLNERRDAKRDRAHGAFRDSLLQEFAAGDGEHRERKIPNSRRHGG